MQFDNFANSKILDFTRLQIREGATPLERNEGRDKHQDLPSFVEPVFGFARQSGGQVPGTAQNSRERYLSIFLDDKQHFSFLEIKNRLFC